MRMCQNMSLQSHYVKCHRYVMRSSKYTWVYLKKKIHTSCLVKNLLEICHNSISLDVIIQKLSKKPIFILAN